MVGRQERIRGVGLTGCAVQVSEVEDVGRAAEGLAAAGAEAGLALLDHGGDGDGAGSEGEEGGETHGDGWCGVLVLGFVGRVERLLWSVEKCFWGWKMLCDGRLSRKLTSPLYLFGSSTVQGQSTPRHH